MKRLWLRVRVPLLIFLVALIIPSTPKTSAFFSLSRAWYAHWPFEVGRSLPNYATVIMGRFVPVWAVVKPHVNMLLDPYDAVTGVILSQGTWEPATLQVLEEHMPPGGTFIDVGAHVGWYSLNAVQRVGQSGHVIAVEPDRKSVV